MHYSRVLCRSLVILTISALIFLALYSVSPLLHRTPEARAAGSIPLLQLPWPASQQYNINGGDTYGCGGHVQPRDYYAIDFNLPSGSSVSAVASGVAHFAAEINKKTSKYYDYGLFVWISHPNGYVSLYAHLSAFPAGVNIGDQHPVMQGEVIGLSGATGNSFGPHLHFSLRSGATSWTNGASALPEPMSGYTGFGQYGIHGPISGDPNNCQPNNPSPMFISEPPQPEPGAVLSISTGITAPSSIPLNQSFTAGYTVTNMGTSPFNLQSLNVILNDPNNKEIFRAGDGNSTPIAPQTSRPFSLTIPSIGSKCKTCSTGTYLVSVAVLLPDGTLWQNLPVTNGAQNLVQVNVTVPAFTIVPSPDPSGWSNLSATAADSANDGWAVGTNNWQPLVEHWDGTQWSIFSSPTVPTGSMSSLYAVSALSTSDVWVLGNYQTYNPNASNSLIAHWNGTQWTEFPSQYLGNPYAIKAISPNNVWTAGDYYDGNQGLVSTIIDHWDGTQWSIVPSPNGGIVKGSNNYLNAINAVSATDIWAVGNYQVGGSSSNPDYTLVEHYNGKTWKIIPSPNIGVGGIELSGVTATSSKDAWAVGYYNNNIGTGAFIDHWDGVHWSISYSTNDGSMFNGVAASSAHDVWAVGPGLNGSKGPAAVVHWNGTQWSTTPTDPISPNSVVAISASNVWIVGNIWPTPLIEAYK